MTSPTDSFPNEGGSTDRRGFFLVGLNAAFDTLSGLVRQASPVAIPVGREVLRPPGAIEEGGFLKTCYRCGTCVDACPAQAIRPMQSDNPDQSGTPYIDPDMQACRVCEHLPCTQSCPSGALKKIARPDIHMGWARWLEKHCLRPTGQDCRLCVEKCPVLGAICVDSSGRISISREMCVGCGVCRQVCPARPKGIDILPT